jgi:hypothetical protein
MTTQFRTDQHMRRLPVFYATFNTSAIVLEGPTPERMLNPEPKKKLCRSTMYSFMERKIESVSRRTYYASNR